MHSEIEDILTKISGTQEERILREVERVYENIAEAQSIWYEKTEFRCPHGCGCCCEHFEPDMLAGEALYMAAWLIQHQPETANRIADGVFSFDEPGRCPMFNPDSVYHCSVYGGRGLICRLFGACCAKNKSGTDSWKPCKSYPQTLLSRHNPPIEHRQYEGEEIKQIWGIYPPVMSELTTQMLGITPDDNSEQLIRDVLPSMIRKLMFILNLKQGK